MAERVLGGRYTVQDKIGTGGMAIVYRGLDRVLGRTVAIKTMLPQYAADPSFAARFKQEAQAAAALQSPYIVSVYDWGKDGETYYIVMEYLRGTDLKSGIRKHGALAPRKVAQIGSQIAQALSIAHRHDIIHRDIKPQNIMVQPDGNIKVMDFGIARAKNSHLTADNSVLGTAHYVSPEQTQGKDLGPTSDIYSLGIVMYEAATGKVPFEGDDAISVAMKQVSEQPVPPRQINPRIDAGLEAIILKCMEKDPANRFQSANELHRVLKAYLTGNSQAVSDATSVMAMPSNSKRSSRTQTMPRAASPLPANQAQGMRATELAEEEERKARKKKTAAGLIAGIAAVAIIAFFLVHTLTNTNAKKIPNLYGLTQEQAIEQIESGDFFLVGEIKEEYSPHVEEGKVIDQDPSANSNATKGTKINITVSKGEQPAEEVIVPDLTNLTPSAAEAELTKVGLKYKVADTIFSDEVDSGRVADQSPKAGETLKEGDTVTYHLSKGVESISASDHTGEQYSAARSALENAGFVVKKAEDWSDQPKGTVIWQDPTGNQPKGTTITLVVSKGQQPAPEPEPQPEPQPTDPEEGQQPNASQN